MMAMEEGKIDFVVRIKQEWHIIKHGVDWSEVEWTGFVKHAVDL